MYTTDNKIFLHQQQLEEHEAFYTYYRHGPLARMVLGQQQVQGVDYAYTLQGWLKGINNSNGYIAYDMGQDAWAAARDAYGYTLHYFSDDYLPINYNTNRPFAEFRSNMETLYPGEYRQLFNGNISATVTSVPTRFLNQMYNYQYDQLNRLVARETYLGLGPDNTWSTLEHSDLFKERFSYDGNGNIKTVLRNGHLSANPLMDSLTYLYTPGTNRLDHIRDRNNGSTAHNSNYNVNRDLKDQITANYAYDAIGNLKSSKWMGDDNISWNIYGKVTEIEKRSLAGVTSRFMHYYYDPSGNRVGQAIRHNAGVSAYYNYLWYVRDAQGNVLAVYKLNNAADATAGGLKLAEQYIYGSSRLGFVNRDQDVDADKLTAVDEDNLGNTYLLNFTRGKKIFELTNHLGNVLVTVNDKRWGVPVGGNPSMVSYWNPELVSWNDYYSFGMLMRSSYLAVQYRYGFNGKEHENEVQAAGNLLDYGNRLYDPLAGRFWSVDPLTKAYPELTPYQFASNRPIDGIDIDGLEVIQYTLAKQGVYGPTAAKIINGTEDGVKASLKNTWNFFAKDAWRAQTWINAGKFIEQGALSMSAVPVAPTPMIDAKADEFINDVVRGDAYSRSAYISEFGANIATGIIADKGISKLSLLAKIGTRTNLAKSWGAATEYVDFNKAVYTQTLKEGTELIQYRVKGLEGTVGNYYAKPGTSPESIGIPSSQIGETLKIRVTSDTKALFSTHQNNTTFYKDGTTPVSGGGQQIYSTELKNNIEIVK